MTYIVYILVFFCLILFQTTVLPAFFNSVNIYDFVLVFIIYMGFFRSVLEGLPTVIFMGLVMDCFSGGAFGIFTTSYLWLYAVVIGTIQFLHVDSRFLMPVAIVIGIIWENIIILLAIIIRNFEIPFPTVFLKIVLEQILWALITGPIVFFIIKRFHSVCEAWFKKLADRNLQSGDF